MTTFSYGHKRRGRFHFLFGGWFGRRRDCSETVDLVELEGLDGHLMRDIGIEPGRTRPVRVKRDHTRC